MTPGLSQYLNYLGLVAPGVVALADGAFLVGYQYAGRDQQYMDHDLMHHAANQLGQELAGLDNGWMLESHAMRVGCVLPPQSHYCPDPTSAMVFEERQQQYAEAGVYYKNRHVLTLTYLSAGATQQHAQNFLFEDGKLGELPSRTTLLQNFIHDAEELTKALSSTLTLQQLNDDAITHFLRYCVTNEDRVVGIAPDKGELGAALGSTRWAPHSQQVGRFHVRVVGIIGWPIGTSPQMFEPLLRVPFPLRLHQRWIPLSTQDAVTVLKNKQADWTQIYSYNPKRLLFSLLAPLTGGSADDRRVLAVNTDAENQALSVEREIEAVQSGTVRLGYFTMSVVLHDTDEGQVEAKASQVVTTINRLGYTANIETDNAGEALFSTWSGHGDKNIRQYYINSQHLGRILPTSVQWQGEEHAPNPLYPPGSGPLIITTSAGQTPFPVNVHRDSLGNFGVVGPSGAGKSYLLGSMILAALQYGNAQVNVFDRDAALIVPVLACGGSYYDIEAMHYAPLAECHDDEQRGWCVRFLETLAKLRDFAMTPQARQDLTIALERLGKGAVEYRTMSHFLAQLQTHAAGLKDALRFYTLGHGGAILDGDPGPDHDANVRAYDMEKILGQGEAISSPVLMYLFHLMTRRMDGRPTFTLADEGWMVAANAIFQDEIEEGSATARKKNNAWGLVLHSPNLDAFDRRDLLLTNMATMFFLPNERALTEGEGGLKKHYTGLGLRQRELEILANDLQQRRHYFMTQGERYRQVFELSSPPLERALLSVNGRDVKRRVLDLHKQYGAEWVPVWLAEQGHKELAMQWRQRNQHKEAA